MSAKASKASASGRRSQPAIDARPRKPANGLFKGTLLDIKIAFTLFAFVNVLAALYAPIQDCDEVFNYWEPTHYLSHGYGLQTWEYSPEYAIRSWLYVALHALIGRVGYLVSFNKSFEFYFTRTVLGLICAYCQTRMFESVSKAVNPRAGVIFMVAMLSSPGMFHAAAAYLPSSFSMYAGMLGASEFIDWRAGSKTPSGIMFFGIGGIVGWPFAAALAAPFLVNEIFMAHFTDEWVELVRKVVDGCVRCTAFLTVSVAVEAFFYRKTVVVPWNIVAYNVFSGSGKGPDIFGTEPFDFYLRNFLLNFHLWSVLAFLALPLLSLQYLTGSHVSAFGLLKNAVFATPFLMWFSIFTLQPHKEERFMYPAYPFLALNAAISLHVILQWLGNANPRTLVGMIPSRYKLLAVGLVITVAVDVGVLRAIGMINAYRAPLQVYPSLARETNLGPETNLCIGKEWYRFPSSYFLPQGVHAKFVKSEFSGLLPGEFSEAKTGFGFFPGTWLIPPGMNDENIEDLSKYTSINHCDYLVDVSFPGSKPTSLEPDYIKDTSTWEPVRCEKFLDSSKTSLLARVIWLPEHRLVPNVFRRRWGDYCLLRRRKPA